ncbi:MAG: lamin tail domain-containing protein [Planctomycetota bacterium]|nr:lamin tail domain-containing protein [Planctomycetota bacterium]
MKKFFVLAAIVAVAFSAVEAKAAMHITEWMYSGSPGEYIEFTNTGATPVDMTGWSYDDDSQIPGTFSLSGFGIVAPSESVVITETSAATFRTAWGLPLSTKILGGYSSNIGNGDEINLYDGSNALADQLTYGSIPRTLNRSGVPTTLAALGANDVSLWDFADTVPGGGPYNLSAVQAPNGWVSNTSGVTGNPGYFQPVPEPTSIALAAIGAMGGVAMMIRRRKAGSLMQFAHERRNGRTILSAVLSVCVIFGLASSANAAGIFISEVSPWSSGNSFIGSDWFELTNSTGSAIDISGWSMDDGSATPGIAPLTGITLVAPGESVVFIEGSDPMLVSDFKTLWFGANPPVGLQIGLYSGSGIGLSTSGDGVNIFNGSNGPEASVTFGGNSGPMTFDNAAGLNNAAISTLSAIGVNGAFAAVNESTSIGSPGAVPEPGSILLLIVGAGAFAFANRRLRA